MKQSELSEHIAGDAVAGPGRAAVATPAPSNPALNGGPGGKKEIDQRVLENIGLARSVARKCLVIFGPLMEPEDLNQEAALALVRAAQYYKPQTGVRFSTYASRCCWQACVGVLRPLLRRRKALPAAIAVVDPSPVDRLTAAELWKLSGHILSPRARQVLYLRYREGLTLKQVGEYHGVGIARARQIEVKALSDLARAVGKRYMNCQGGKIGLNFS